MGGPVWLSSWEVAWLPGSQVAQEGGGPSGSPAVLTLRGPPRKIQEGAAGPKVGVRMNWSDRHRHSGTLASGLMARLALCPPVRAATGS